MVFGRGFFGSLFGNYRILFRYSLFLSLFKLFWLLYIFKYTFVLLIILKIYALAYIFNSFYFILIANLYCKIFRILRRLYMQ